MKANSLSCHLADVHNVYQQTVVAKELLELKPAVTYDVTGWSPARLACPYPGCDGILTGKWMMWRHFRDIHSIDLIKVPKEGKFPQCRQCRMQVGPWYPRHAYTKECQVGVERSKQREAGVKSALALWQQFSVHGNVLEQVEVFKSLGHLLVQDDDNIWAIRTQLWKVRVTWSRIGQVLQGENVSP